VPHRILFLCKKKYLGESGKEQNIFPKSDLDRDQSFSYTLYNTVLRWDAPDIQPDDPLF
jgi:hypothetical protein